MYVISTFYLQRWCDAFRRPGYHSSVKTNNGVESLNKLFKHCYNNLRTDKTVTGLCQIMRDSFFPDTIHRYTIDNVKFSSDFKLYDESIPPYLHNRPQWFVKHCMRRLHAATEFIGEDIQILTASTFIVRGQSFKQQQDSNERNSYKVFLGSDDEYPTCECVDFKLHCLPCKHMFAILTVVPGYSWESLPVCFSTSPLYNIDESVFSADQKQDLVYNLSTPVSQTTTVNQKNSVGLSDQLNDQTNATGEDHTMDIMCTEDIEVSSPHTALPQDEGNSKAINSLAVSLRSNLQCLQDFSYLCKEKASLTTVNNCIESALHTANSFLKREGGLILQPTPEKRRKVSKEKANKLRCLPSRKRKKRLSLFDRYKNRVGKFADTMKASSHISIPESKAKQVNRKTIVKKYQNMQKEKPGNKKDSMKDAAVKKREKKVTEDIQIVGIYMQCTVDPCKRRIMTDRDFEIILSSNWLNDTIINTAQNCLHTQFELPGLYDTSLGPHLSYPKAEVFHQILHD